MSTPPTPTVPPAVAQWLVERFDAEMAAREKSPAVRTLALALSLTMQAEAAGIAVREVNADVWDEYDMGVYIGPRHKRETPALAAALGLDSRVVEPCVDPARSIEEFSAVIDGIRVRTQHTLPTSALAADEPAAVAS